MADLRVLLADDEAAIRSAMRELIEHEPDMEVAGVAGDADEAIELAMRLHPDVAVLDVRMPGGGGPRAAAELRRLSPTTRAIAFSAYQDRTSVLSMLDAGAVGYLVKGAPNAEITATIRSAGSDARSEAVEEHAQLRPAGKLRVLVADDDERVRQALTDMLGAHSEIEVVGVASDAMQAVRLANLHRPDVALVDGRMPGGGASAVKEIRSSVPETHVVVLSARVGREVVKEMLEAGATSYLVKGTTNDEILEAIRQAARGGTTLSGEVAGPVLDQLVLELNRPAALEASQRAERVARIRAVMDDGGPDIVFQPIFNLETGEAVGVEALARFPEGPRRSPSVWFSDAAELGMTIEFELSAVRAALSWCDRLPEKAWLALNVSPETVCSQELPRLLREARGQRIVLEMTEHSPVMDYDALILALDRLRGDAVRVAVDDAGAGFASLRHILMVAPDFIKLDVSLTRGIATDTRRRALARALTMFGSDIGGTVIAEGVETKEDLHALSELRVPCAQGFHLAPPAPATGALAAIG
jgi:DNA-binding NarL/FixJ family response regulator/EAL domain-containing protein (putative c-di-GMP-specific phosphodiesterase class I)